jgi:hypothetical protein
MHGSFDKQGETGNRSSRRWSIGVFAVPVFVVIALIGLALSQPEAANWISAAVQAEFVGSSLPQEVVPTLLAQPAMTVRAGRLY